MTEITGDPARLPAEIDMLQEERDSWRTFALGGGLGKCRHPDPPTTHQADLPGGTVIERFDPETRSKSVYPVGAA